MGLAVEGEVMTCGVEVLIPVEAVDFRVLRPARRCRQHIWQSEVLEESERVRLHAEWKAGRPAGRGHA